MRPGRTPFRPLVAVLVVAGLGASSLAWAAEDHIKGIITGRGESGSVIVQTDSARLTIAMSDVTRIRRIDGIRPVIVSSADLIPGLRIKAEGTFDTADRLTAKEVTFTRDDFKIAAAIQGGVMPTDQRSLVNERNIQQNTQELAGQKAELGQHAQELAAQSGRISADEQKMIATAGLLNTRISSLDDFTPLKTITIYFKNGRYEVSNSDKALLQQFATEARGTSGYMIQVQAYASDVGPYQLNQRLSLQRADRVTQLLQQSGVPLTNVFVPAGMGITNQVATNKTQKGQSENRRAVVTLLQNKGLETK